MQMHRRMPDRKTLGTAYNLNPDTRPVEARLLQPGDIVVLEAGHPVVVSKMLRRGSTVRIWGLYIWQKPHEARWPLGTFEDAQRLPTAVPGEYPATATR